MSGDAGIIRAIPSRMAPILFVFEDNLFVTKLWRGINQENPDEGCLLRILNMRQSSVECINQALEGFKKKIRICLECIPSGRKPDLHPEIH
jgi:hypothetical protein